MVSWWKRYDQTDAPVVTDGATRSHRHHGEKTRPAHTHRHHGSRGDVKHINQRPTFREIIGLAWLDILTMAAMGAVGLGVYMAPPAPSRSFPVDFQDGEIVYPQFAYPLRKEVVPIWLAAFLASIIPIVFIVLFQIRIRSFWDMYAGISGLLYSLINAAVFQVFIKWLIGGLRPHFLTVCKPSISAAAVPSGNGFQSIMYDRKICTGDQKEINDSLESFPSGHSTAAFAGFVFLFLYFNAKLKLMSNHHPAYWKMVITFAPLLGATLIAGALTIDEFHNWYDCVAGAVIGSMMALTSFRMVYASVWDWRFNHIPLPRSGKGTADYAGFRYTRGECEEWATAMVTRRAGFGEGIEGVSGNSFDAVGISGGAAVAGSRHHSRSRSGGDHHHTTTTVA